MNDEPEEMWKEVVAAYFKVLFQSLIVEELRENNENFR